MSRIISTKDFTERQKRILKGFAYEQSLAISDIQKLNSEDISLATLKRDLLPLVDQGYIEKTGKSRNTEYILTNKGLLTRTFEVPGYVEKEIYQKTLLRSYNFKIFALLQSEEIFTSEELGILEQATQTFLTNGEGASDTIHQKELERFIIEMSWKSSQIEGNTYTLLDTEYLLKKGIPSGKNTESETQMILNHKKALNFVFTYSEKYEELSVAKVEDLHALLLDNLGVARNLRSRAVGITGTEYRPLDNEYQIREALEDLIRAINAVSNPLEKSLLAVIGISYLQPFEDGNKRTGRVLANALLLAYGRAPLSYRNIAPRLYREAMLVFYEQNSISAFKEVFMQQYIFACENYNIARDSNVTERLEE